MGGLADLRSRVVAALAPTNGDGWNVQPTLVDSITPPAYVLTWGDPWMAPQTHCIWQTRLVVVAISHRTDIATGVEVLEQLVETALSRLTTAGLPSISASAPGPWRHGGINYQASRLTVIQPVVPGGSDG